MSQENQFPPCMGNEWSTGAKECTGGYDPSFTHPSGHHIRSKCEYFEECGRAFRNKQASAYQVRPSPAPISVNYARPYQAPQAAPVQQQQQVYAAAVRPAMPMTTTAPTHTYQPQQPVQHYTQQQHASVPVQYKPVEMMPKNWFAVPQVLAVHEDRENRPWLSLFTEMGRGTGMVVGLVVADFFSNVRLGR